MAAPNATTFAQNAKALQDKLARLHDDLDPTRQAQPQPRWQLAAGTHSPQLRASIVARVFGDELSPWPALDRLNERPAQLALLDRATLLRSLGLLAVASRPGALRSCIDRKARDGLRSLLGDAFARLAGHSERGRPAPTVAATWTPLHWACLGYFDWAALTPPAERVLRRLAQLSLPPGLLGMRALQPVYAAELAPADALARLDQLELRWPV